jgi:hypothetical protein
MTMDADTSTAGLLAFLDDAARVAIDRLRGFAADYAMFYGGSAIPTAVVSLIRAVEARDDDLRDEAVSEVDAICRETLNSAEAWRASNLPANTPEKHARLATIQDRCDRITAIDACCAALDLIASWRSDPDDAGGESETVAEAHSNARALVTAAVGNLPRARPRAATGYAPEGMTRGDDIRPTPGAGGTLVARLIDRGAFALLCGAPNAGKSMIAALLGWHVANGTPLYDRCTTARSMVVYVAMEGGERFADRLRALHARHGGGDNLLLLPRAFDLTDEAQSAALIEALNEASRSMILPLGVVIIDTVARALNGADESGAVPMGAFLRTVAQIQELGATVIALHHPVKGGDDPRGHGSLKAACDTIVNISAAGGSHVARVTKQRDMSCDGGFRFRIVPEGRSALAEIIGEPEGGAALAKASLADTLAGDVALAAASGMPLKANGKAGLYNRRLELSPALRRLGRDPLAGLVREAIAAGRVLNQRGTLLPALQ